MAKPKDGPAVLGQYIPLQYHTNMLQDRARMVGFKEALEKAVPEGAKVMELGGGTGVLSFFASKNASKVWYVEHNPELVEAARKFLKLNSVADKVEIVHGDAFKYLPPEPVDVVVCEMIHVGMLREKQVQVMTSFKERYQKKFKAPLPLFVPEAAIMAVQPIQQSFDFYGYQVPTPLFFDGTMAQTSAQDLGDPAVYQMLVYNKDIPEQYDWEGKISIKAAGNLNALRFITKNVLALLVKENKAVEWFSQYLVMPLDKPISVVTGDTIQVNFSYKAGESIESLADTLIAKKI